jgi:anti-sigma28 factor (negative regulator of flagellin synthesis)
MKVNDPNLTCMKPENVGAGLDRTQQTQHAEQIARQRVGGDGKPSGDSPDQVSLSALGSQLRALSVDSPERVAHIDKLTSDIQARNYFVDAYQLSYAMVEDALRPAV